MEQAQSTRLGAGLKASDAAPERRKVEPLCAQPFPSGWPLVVRSPAVRERIEALFKDVITPLVEADGGGVELIDVTEGVVKVRMLGAYRGCPSIPNLLQGVLEPAVRHVLGAQAKVVLVV